MPSAAPRSAVTRDAGPEALAARLYAEQRPRLLAIARRNSADAEDAEEALQDAFVLFIDRFDPHCEAPPLAWLTLTLKRRCWALYGRRRQAPRAAGDALERQRDPRGEEGHPDDLLEVAVELARLRRGMAALPPDQRRALGLLALGYSYREICELTGWTYAKLNHCLARGRAQLRAE